MSVLSKYKNHIEKYPKNLFYYLMNRAIIAWESNKNITLSKLLEHTKFWITELINFYDNRKEHLERKSMRAFHDIYGLSFGSFSHTLITERTIHGYGQFYEIFFYNGDIVKTLDEIYTKRNVSGILYPKLSEITIRELKEML